MLLDTNIAIALKESNWQYKIEDISLFSIENIGKTLKAMDIDTYRGKDVLIKVKCPLCDEIHFYNYHIANIIKKDIIIGGCDKLGVPIFFIGKKNTIIKRVQEYIQINNKIYAMI